MRGVFLKPDEREKLSRKPGFCQLEKSAWKIGAHNNICNSKPSGRGRRSICSRASPPKGRSGSSISVAVRAIRPSFSLNRFPHAELIGLDSSDDMLAKARARLPRVKFEKADVAHWRGAGPFDLIFANAVLQWVPDHIGLMVRLVARTRARRRSRGADARQFRSALACSDAQGRRARAVQRQACRRERGARDDRRLRRLLCCVGAALRRDRYLAHDLRSCACPDRTPLSNGSKGRDCARFSTRSPPTRGKPFSPNIATRSPSLIPRSPTGACCCLSHASSSSRPAMKPPRRMVSDALTRAAQDRREGERKGCMSAYQRSALAAALVVLTMQRRGSGAGQGQPRRPSCCRRSPIPPIPSFPPKRCSAAR